MKIAGYGRGILAVCAATALSVGAFSASAQEASPQPGPMAIPAGCSVAADGLLNPRYLAIDSDGTVYVTEAGNAGDEMLYAPTGEGTPAAAEAITTRGLSGQVSRIAPDGSVSVVATGLPSYSFGSEIVGAAGITMIDGTLYVAVGGPGPATPLVEPIANQNSVVAIDPATGAITTVADIGAYEIASNPDPNAVDSDLYGIDAGNDGMLYVADAGGNTVYKVDPATGQFSVAAVIPGIQTPDGPANPARGGAKQIDPVPTGVDVAADGTVHVSLLSGGPFIPGTAGVVAIAADGSVSDYASGLTMLADVTTGPDGALYVTQLSDNFLAGEMPAPGSVVRINADGSTQTVLSGLFLANGIEFGPDGSLYVVINTTAPVGAPPSGVVLKCDIGAEGAAASPEAAASLAPAADQAVSLIDFNVDPKRTTIASGTDVTLTITNDGATVHDFNIDALNIHAGYLNPGESATVTVNAAAGDYTYYCSIPGHQPAGMVGTLVVQ